MRGDAWLQSRARSNILGRVKLWTKVLTVWKLYSLKIDLVGWGAFSTSTARAIINGLKLILCGYLSGELMLDA